ncbi:Holliday junction resolvase RuvX [Ornithinimicrobium sp. Y1694]|uniref:Holliday junction resolvase RuvX n=1 Tax=Ornithinimicrobium sp. Y1694 TaxID=3418590 RepID=UPI003CECEAF1
MTEREREPVSEGERPVQPTGVLIGVDVGEVRVGVAASDALGLLAHPVLTLKRDKKRRSDIDELLGICAEREAVGVVVGLPRSLSGAEGLAAERARRYAGVLQRRLEVPVWLWDERLTTVDAHRSLHTAGVSGRQQRGVVDQAAAVLILQAALDARRAGRPPGTPLAGS